MPKLQDPTTFVIDGVKNKMITEQEMRRGLICFAFSAHGMEMDQSAQDPKMNMANMDTNEQEVAHPFFSHMGMPEAVGVFSLRLGGLVYRDDDKTNPDFAFHFETGLTKFIGPYTQ